jgi:hypothetical protein
MVSYSKKDYTFLRFEKSKRTGKKYDAVLKNKKTGREVRVPFGASSYEQYKDSTGLGLYSSKNHNDKKRRASYRSRHKNDNLNDYSPGFFSWRFLW